MDLEGADEVWRKRLREMEERLEESERRREEEVQRALREAERQRALAAQREEALREEARRREEELRDEAQRNAAALAAQRDEALREEARRREEELRDEAQRNAAALAAQRDEALREAERRREEAERAAAEIQAQRDDALRRNPRAAPTPSLSPPKVYLDFEKVQHDFFSRGNLELRWPNLKEVVLPRAEVPPGNRHATKFNNNPNAFKAPNSPDMFSSLLYRIQNRNEPLTKGTKLANVVSGGMCLVILAPSGAGKTRKALEMLGIRNGYYLTHRQRNDNNPGSFALTSVLAKITDLTHVDWKTQLDSTPRQDLKIFDQRRKAVHFAMRCVLKAYVSVHSEWTKVLYRRTHPVTSRLKSLRNLPDVIPPATWLLAQLYPKAFFGLDVFERLALEFFEKCDPFDRTALGYFPAFWECVIDEAQVFAKQLQTTFAREINSGNSPRPLLSAVISGVHEATARGSVVLGTGLPLVTEWSFRCADAATNETSRFMFRDFPLLTRDEVRTTLLRFLSCENDPKLDEACEWLTGRPGWTTSFVEEALRENATVSELLDRYVRKMTDPAGNFERGPAGFFKVLKEKPAEFICRGTRVANPYTAALAEAFRVSLGFPERMARSPALVEIGIGYAISIPEDIGVDTIVKAEPLILEAARIFRERYFGADSQDSDFETGKLSKYTATNHILQALLGGQNSLESCAVLGDVARGLPEAFRGKWELPSWRYGRLSFSGKTAFPNMMLNALDPSADVLRLWFPDDDACPDAVAVVRNAERTRVMVILIQFKLSIKFGVQAAMHTVDPSKMYHVNRSVPPGSTTGLEQVRTAEGLKSVLDKIAERNAPVMRVLVSGATTGDDVSTGMLSHNRAGLIGQDLRVVVDVRQLEQVFGGRSLGMLEGASP